MIVVNWFWRMFGGPVQRGIIVSSGKIPLAFSQHRPRVCHISEFYWLILPSERGPDCEIPMT
jgi:hypothetical protein